MVTHIKIVIITGSAHKNSTSACLADSFEKGALEAGHEVFRFDAGFKKVHPCIGCEHCHETEDGCVFKDDMEELNPKLLEAEAVVFATPTYYYMFSAWIKAVIDRFYANDRKLIGGKKTGLLLTYGDVVENTDEGPLTSFKWMSDYLQWERAGVLVAKACYTMEDMLKTNYPEQAFEFGKTFAS